MAEPTLPPRLRKQRILGPCPNCGDFISFTSDVGADNDNKRFIGQCVLCQLSIATEVTCIEKDTTNV